MTDEACHYTKVFNLPDIFQGGLLPSPPLASYGISREAVEADPTRHGFRVYRDGGRRMFRNDTIPHRTFPDRVSAASWYEGERFAVAFSRAGWCGSALGYLPPGAAETGWAYRLVLDLAGLDVFGWHQFQDRCNVPGCYRRRIGDLSRAKGDDPQD